MQIINELKELGLNENEIKVYLSCLTGQGLNAKQIAKNTELIRTTVYGVLDSLIQKGLISSINKEGIKIFHSSSPKELLNILEQKKEKIKLIIPELEKYQQKSQIKYKAEIFEGINGVKTVTNDIISKKNETIKVIGIGQKWLEFSDIFTKIYYRKKKENNVYTHTILADNKDERNFLKEKNFINSKIRFIKNMDFKNAVTYIYHDKVSFVVYDKEFPRGFIIQDKDFNDIQNKLFDKIWGESKS